ncbi:MAG: B12-binding domain-containing radical SAM protein [Thermodesulfobacteriota bacterium]
MNQEKSGIHTLLIAPPVWTPIYPYLALPVLTAYLRREGCSVSQYDASLDFFLYHLLRARAWSPGEFRDPEAFFEPQQLIHRLQETRRLLVALSRIHGPLGIAFNSLRWPGAASMEGMIDLCDREGNPFLSFCEDRLAPRIQDEGPHIVGISLSTPHQLLPALTVSRFIKKRFPGIHVVLGGKHCLALHEGFLQEPGLFREFFDSLIPHQGETPLRALIDAVGSGRGLTGVPGLCFLEDGAVRVNRPSPPLPLRDLPPPDFHGLDLGGYLVPRSFLPLRFSDGCYWGRCTFCSRHQQGPPRMLPPDQAVAQMAQISQGYGVRDFALNDDCLPPPYVEAFCRKVMEAGLRVSIQLYGRPDRGFTRERLKVMAEAGVKELRWGIESANPRILRLMEKGTAPDVTLKILEDAAGLGIWNHACMILGFPTETRQEAEETISWIRDNRGVIHSFYLFEFHLNNESRIYEEPEAFGISQILPHPGPFSTLASFNCDRGMDRDEVGELVREARRSLISETYGYPFWYYLRDREYLQLYLDRYGLEAVAGMHVDPTGFSVANTPKS